MYVKIRVFPGAKKEEFRKLSDDHFEVIVREPAERNLANRKVAELLSAHFAVPVGKVRLISGHRSPSKIFRIG